VEDRTAVLLGALLGAVAGGVAGYLYLTDNGRRLREELEPRLSEFADGLDQARVAARRAGESIGQSLESAERLVGAARGASRSDDGLERG
jgi:gas vesicle protein